MDGKHIVIKQPKNSGSYFFNYKGSFSVVLLALADANYKFLYVDVGCNGRISDGGVFRNSSLSSAMENNLLNIPMPRYIGDVLLPYVIVADDAFPLKENIMKPYPSRALTKKKRITNYRISRARRVSENAFGIMANRFRVFLSPMELNPENVEKIVLASCVLHNYLRDKSPLQYLPPGSVDNENVETGNIEHAQWRSTPNAMHQLVVTGRNNYTLSAKEVRDNFSNYFNSEEGSIPWQENFI